MNIQVFHKTLRDVDKNTVKQLSENLPEILLERIFQQKSVMERCLRLQSWQVLKEFIESEGRSENLEEISFEEKGKPFFPNSDLHFNITNSKNTILVCVNDQPVGVDLEFERPVKESIFSRVFQEEEIAFLKNYNNSSEKFIWLWTRKEAVVKLFGGGISMGMNNFSALEDRIIAFDKKVELKKVELVSGTAHYAIFV